MADTVAVMNRGRIEQLGPPTELYSAPRTVFVANFLGQSNLVAGRREGGGGRGLVPVACHGQTVLLPADRCTAPGDSMLVGVRPEKVQLVPRGAAPPEGANRLFGGEVRDASFTGVSTQYLVRMPWGQDLTVFVQNVGGGLPLPAGTPVVLGWHPEHTFGLPAETADLVGPREAHLTTPAPAGG